MCFYSHFSCTKYYVQPCLVHTSNFDCLDCAAALLMRYNRCPSYNQSVLAFNHFSLVQFMIFFSLCLFVFESTCKRTFVNPFRVNQRLNCRCKTALCLYRHNCWALAVHGISCVKYSHFFHSLFHADQKIFSIEAATAINLSVNLLLISHRSNVTSM